MTTTNTRCARLGNNCPSKRNCHRHEDPRDIEFTDAALYVRREAGASACDMVSFINQVTTFKEES
jgi:hypothetical protein